MNSYAQLMRIDKPIGTLLLLWPTLWGLWFAAKGIPPLPIVCIFIVGVFVMRSAGCVINDLSDRKFDGSVARTKTRPLVTGRIKVSEAQRLFIALSLLALCCVVCLNYFTIAMAIIAFLLTLLYPLMKRITYWPQAILGLAFAWGIPMAYTAVTNSLPWEAWELFFITWMWILAYDTIYAMVDRNDDILIGVKSTAIKLQKFDVLFVVGLQILVLIGFLFFAQQQGLSWLFYPAWCMAAGFVIYQAFLIRGREPQQCFKAFLNNHWLGAIIFLGVALSLP